MSSEVDDNTWNNYFTIEFTGRQTKNCRNCKILPEEGNYYLDECHFSETKDRIIDFNSIRNTLFLHNCCSFSNCTSNLKGTCINFLIDRNDQSESHCSIVQRRFCCTKNQGFEEGQFSYTRLGKNDLNYVNYIIESSLSDAGSNKGWANCYTVNNKIVVSSTNFSFCNTDRQAVGFFNPGSETFTVKFNYTTVVNNTGKNGMILNIYYNALVDSCNFINNYIVGLEDTTLIYHWNSPITIKSCCFINNIANTSFHDYQGQLTVDSCYIDNSISKTFFRAGAVLTNQQQLFINNLTHHSTDACNLKTANIEKTTDKENDFPIVYCALVSIYNSL